MSGYDKLYGAGAGVLGGIADYFTANATNEANQRLSRENIAAQAANQERGLNSLTGNSDFQNTTRSDGGGFDLSQIGGADAAEARRSTAASDIFRAEKLGNASANFDFNLPNLQAAQGVVDRDIGVTQSNFDRQANDVIEQQRRNFGGINNTNEVPAILDSLRNTAQEFNFGRERQALDLLGKSNTADLGTLSNLNSAFAPQAPAPSFSSQSGAGNTAANLIAQTPPPAPAIDLGGALPFAAAGSTIGNLHGQAQRNAENTAFNKALAASGKRIPE